MKSNRLWKVSVIAVQVEICWRVIASKMVYCSYAGSRCVLMSFISLFFFLFHFLFYCRTRWVITVESQLPRTARESSDRGHILVPHRALLYPFPDVPPLENSTVRRPKDTVGSQVDACASFIFCYLLFGWQMCRDCAKPAQSPDSSPTPPTPFNQL